MTLIDCPECGRTLEFFKDDSSRRCPAISSFFRLTRMGFISPYSRRLFISGFRSPRSLRILFLTLICSSGICMRAV